MSSLSREAILIPVKSLDQAKLRLSRMLQHADRRRLGLAMLADVLRATDKWESRFIVTSDPDAEAVGLAFGCSLVPDPGRGLNVALEEGTRSAVQSGAESLLILPSDVPTVSAGDVTALFGFVEEVVISTSPDGGTNALLRRPPERIGLSFGPGSAAAHREAALRAGASVRVIQMSSLFLDIDRFDDLIELGGLPNARDSVRLARELIDRRTQSSDGG